jgi:hypothetical protein
MKGDPGRAKHLRQSLDSAESVVFPRLRRHTTMVILGIEGTQYSSGGNCVLCPRNSEVSFLKARGSPGGRRQ